ncbi:MULTISPECIES: integrase core domain-containing protein [unclassified Streptomyces]|uniref:integrase core domain-containing protein n=1 Tax=unclassified Streptomyces TaxID=2593676 RepID=UPI0038179973
MTSKKVSQLLIDLGATRSHSRPRASNDNPYSESRFRTTKHAADYPARFDSLAHAREWMDTFTAYYNHGHRHSGTGLHTTPASVHFGTAEQVRDQRTVALTEAYERHPERFARRPTPPEIPGHVWITDPTKRRRPSHKVHSNTNVSFDLTTTGSEQFSARPGRLYSPLAVPPPL